MPKLRRIRQVEEVDAELEACGVQTNNRVDFETAEIYIAIPSPIAGRCDPGCRSGHRGRRSKVVPQCACTSASVLKERTATGPAKLSSMVMPEIERWCLGSVEWHPPPAQRYASAADWIRTVQHSKRRCRSGASGTLQPASLREKRLRAPA